MNKKSIWGKALLILVILVVAVGLSLALLWSGPETKPKEKTSSAKIVQTVEVNPLTRSVAVSVFGSVIPARRVVIRPQVSGQVVMQSSAMTIGGLVNHFLTKICTPSEAIVLSTPNIGIWALIARWLNIGMVNHRIDQQLKCQVNITMIARVKR